jgi:hypothetical protein
MIKVSSMLSRLVLVGIAAIAFPKQLIADREDQWIFRTISSANGEEPVAIFLSSHYGEVILRATCDLSGAMVILEYPLDRQLRLTDADKVLSIGFFEDSGAKFSTEIANGLMIGRAKPDADLLRIARDKRDLEVYAPNDMEEPWYVGHAEPLRRVIEICHAFSRQQ